MVIAAIGSFGYKVMFFLHILSVIVAFAPAFVNPFLGARYRKQGGMPSDLAAMLAENSAKVHGPALVVVGIIGCGLVGMSEKVYTFGQTWITVALLLWFIMLGLVFGVLIPAEKKLGQGDKSVEKIVSGVGGGLHLLLAVMLIVMIWKPGF